MPRFGEPSIHIVGVAINVGLGWPAHQMARQTLQKDQGAPEPPARAPGHGSPFGWSCHHWVENVGQAAL
jgi:hypothetical protein